MTIPVLKTLIQQANVKTLVVVVGRFPLTVAQNKLLHRLEWNACSFGGAWLGGPTQHGEKKITLFLPSHE